MDFILFLIFCVAIFFYFLNHQFTYWKRKNVPFLEPEYFYGNSRGVGRKVFSGIFYKDLYFKVKKLGPISGFYLFTQPAVIVTDLDLIKRILVKDFNSFQDRGGYYNEKDDPTSADISVIEGEKWRTLRGKLTKVLTSGKMKMMFPIISEVTDRMIDQIAVESKENKALELKTFLSRYTTDVIGEVAFGIYCSSLEDTSTQFYQVGMKAFTNMSYIKRTFTRYYPNLSRKLGITVTNPEVVNFYKNIVEQTIKYRDENQIARNDILSMLVEMMRNSELTFNQVLTQCIMFFLGGHETTSTVLTFTLYEMSQQKEVQEKARKEIATVLKKHEGNFTYEAVNEMKYLEQCINESMRIHTPGPSTRRIASTNYHVPNTKITLEKGTQVYISMLGIHIDPEIYSDPFVYNPDRFSPEEVEKRHEFSFMPFGSGPRMCIGNRFAVLEVKIALAKLLMNYEFELDRTKTPVPLDYEVKRVILTPTSDIFIHFTKI